MDDPDRVQPRRDSTRLTVTACHWPPAGMALRRLATSGRSRSPATTLFFEAELLGMDELPYRTIINLQPAPRELGDQAAQGEVALDSF